MALGKSGRLALSGTSSSKKKKKKKRGRIGVARGKFEVPASLDEDDPEIVRLFEGAEMPDRV